MLHALSTSRSNLSPADLQQLDQLCLAFERAWQSGASPHIEDHLPQVDAKLRTALLEELIALEVDLRRTAGANVVLQEYLDRFPSQSDAARRGFALAPPHHPSPRGVLDCGRRDGNDTNAGGDTPAAPPEAPTHIDRFQIRRLLGAGAYGAVYLAHDPVIDRLVAIKQPLPARIGSDEDVARYVDEARNAARLDHPGIVRVHDVRHDGDSLFVVQQYVQGQSLAELLEHERPDPARAARWIVGVAEALGHAHQQGVFHRDVKPANILIDPLDQPHVVDFGLAIHAAAQLAHRGELAGSPAYMSPEQVRRETHRLDGRSDIWSLGVILYEMLCGSRPFDCARSGELYDEIQYREPRPLRQRDESIPGELDRICAKCLEKRMTDRYGSAFNLADDLRHFLDGSAQPVVDATEAHGGEPDARAPSPPRIVPKGLRSFDASDAEAFLELLPGPRDRDGLPPTICFWKTRLEQTDADETVPVGVMYGPSGCGKSSLVKAGLLPRLADHVVPVYVEATPADTEVWLLKGIKKRLPDLREDQSLPEVLEALREQGLGGGRKLLLVLDQFEQWLHTHVDEPTSQLLYALRQCDGGRVQCLVLVREEYAIPCLRFLAQLDLEMREGENFGLVDLFDQRHSEKVLRLFGQAYDALPQMDAELLPPQQEFIHQSVQGLSDDKGRIVCVRLALFAETVKSKPWLPSTLTQLGGAKGIGVTFLEEALSADSAKPTHRLHQKAARAVLKELLPESGSDDIKGAMHSYEEILQASGYGHRPADFDAVMHLLDHELRLITPTDPEGRQPEESEDSVSDPAVRYYQLTHDYLVPSLRDWLTRKQKETRCGRAELRLAERSVLWNAKRENRNLPKVWEHLNIRLLTCKKNWTEPQRQMMRKSHRWHVTRLTMLAILLTLLGGSVFEAYRYVRGTNLAESIGSAEPDELKELIDELSGFRHWARRPLRRMAASDNPHRQLRGSLALLPEDASQVLRLARRLLDCGVDEFSVVRNSLAPHKELLVPNLWAMFHDTGGDTQQRFHAAMALAEYAPSAAQWKDEDFSFVVRELLSSHPEERRRLRGYLSPISVRLLPQLETCFDDSSQRDAVRESAAVALADFAEGDLTRIALLASRATEGQYKIIFRVLAEGRDKREAVVTTLTNLVNQEPADMLPDPDRVQLGNLRAGAAINLLRLGEVEQSFGAFQIQDDPESLTQFVHRCRARDVRASELVDALQKAANVYARFALLLALGDFGLHEIPDTRRDALIQQLTVSYKTDPSSAIHGATGWLLCRWGYQGRVTEVDQTKRDYDEGYEWFVKEIQVASSGTTVGPPPEDPSQLPDEDSKIYLTLVVFRPGEYLMGSAEGDENHTIEEVLHRVKLPRTFAVSSQEITWQQFEPYDGGWHRREWQQQFGRTLTPQSPAFGVNWLEAVQYCRSITTQAGLPASEQYFGNPRSLPKDAEGNPEQWPVHLERRGFRLLTEAEWEYVCRSGMRTAYSFGSDPRLLMHYAWIEDNSEGWSHPPGQLRPNLRGLFDMHGNMDEWCHDCFDDYYDTAVSEDVGGPREGSVRVLRGGGWGSDPGNCRSASRYKGLPDFRYSNLGFRVATTLSASPAREASAR